MNSIRIGVSMFKNNSIRNNTFNLINVNRSFINKNFINKRNIHKSIPNLLKSSIPSTPPVSPTKTNPNTTTSTTTSTTDPTTNKPDFSKHPILNKIPKFLQPFSVRFINAPISHVTSFLILHELTAILPLIGLWYTFHQFPDFIPNLDFTNMGINKITEIIDKSMNKFDFSNYSINEKANVLLEGAYAYIIVKSLLPLRIILSLSLMPSFSKFFVVPMNKILGKLFKRNRSKKNKSKVDGIDNNELNVKLKKVNKPRL